MARTVPENMRPGDKFVMDVKGEGPEGSIIRTINELCHQQRTPHVHLVTNNGHRCLQFSRGGRRG